MRKNDQLSEQIQHRNDEELNHALAIFARYAKDREIAERLQEGEIEMVGEISKVELLTQVEIDSEVEDDRWHSEELKKIEKETEDRKPEVRHIIASIPDKYKRRSYAGERSALGANPTSQPRGS